MNERIRGLSIGLDLDTAVLDRSLSSVKRSFRDLNGALKTNLNNFKFTEKSVDSYKNAIRDLDRTMQGQRKNVDSLKSKLDELTNAGKSHTKEASQIRQEYNKQADALNALEKQYENTKNEFIAFNKEQQLANTKLGKVSKQFEELGPKLSGVGNTMKGIGTTMSTYVTAPIAAGFGLSIKTAADFEAQMSRVGAIAQTSKSEMKALSDQAIDLGANTSKSASEVAKGMENLASMGFNAKQIMGAMPGVISASEASGADMAQTADVMAAAINGFSLKASDAGHVADVLAQAANQSAADINDMQYALKYAAGPANALGISLEETSAAIGIMTDAGLDGSNAGTALRGSLLSLLDPSEKNSKLLANMGIQLEDSEGNFVGIAMMIDQFKQSLSGMTNTQKAATLSSLVGKEAVSGFLTLMEAGPEKIGKMTYALENSDGASKKAADQMKNNLKGSLEQLGGAFESAGIIIGNILAPSLRWLADQLAKVVDALSGAPHWLQVLAVTFGVLAAAIGPIIFGLGAFIAVIGNAMTTLAPMIMAVSKAGGVFGFLTTKVLPLISKVPLLSGVFTALTGPIGIAIAIIGVLTGAFILAYKKSETFRNIVNAAMNGVKAAFNGLLTFIKPFATGITNTFNSAINAVKAFAMQIGGQIKTFWNENGTEIKQALTNIFNVVKSVFNAIYTVINTVFNVLILPVIKVAMKVISTVMKLAWDVIKALVVSTWNNIKGVIKGALDIIMGVVKVFSSLFTGNWKGLWQGIKQIVSGAVQLLWNLIQLWFVGKIIGSVKAFGGLFKSLMNGIWSGIKNIFSAALSFVWNRSKSTWTTTLNFSKNIFNTLRSFFSTIWNAIKSVFTNSLAGIWNGIKSRFTQILNFGRNTFTNLRNSMKSIWDSIKSNTVDRVKTMKDSVTGIFTSMGKGIKGQIDKVKGHISGMTSGVKSGLNKLIGGVNWVGAKLGMDKIPSIKLSTGTRALTSNGKLAQDTFATVGDKGRGNGPNGFRHEMVKYPNGRTILTPNRDTKMFLPKGSEVINGQDTYNYLNTPRFAQGTKKSAFQSIGDTIGNKFNEGVSAAKAMAGNAVKGAKNVGKKALKAIGDVYDFATNPGKLVDKMLKTFGVDFSFVKGDILGGLMKGMYKKLKSSTKKLITGWFEESGGNADGSSFMNYRISTIYSPNARPPGYPYPAAHFGVDFATPQMTKINAPTAGTLSTVFDPHGGQVAILKMANGWQQFFMHMEKVAKAGAIKRGAYLGHTGGAEGLRNSGTWSNGPHLHYQVNKGSSTWNAGTVNPLDFLKNIGIKAGVKGKGTWAERIRQAAKQMKTTVTESQVNGILAQIQRESGFNESIVQSSAVWDVNMANGTPARGLLQYVPSTFANFAVKGYGNINNGYHQLLAFFNNSNWPNDIQYGKSGWGPRGSRRFKTGGYITSPGWYNLSDGGYPEWVISTDPARRSESMNMLAMAANQIQGAPSIGNKRPHQLNMSSDDSLLEAVIEQNGILMNMLEKLTGIEAKPVINDDDIGKANDRYTAKNFTKNNVTRGRLNYV